MVVLTPNIGILETNWLDSACPSLWQSPLEEDHLTLEHLQDERFIFLQFSVMVGICTEPGGFVGRADSLLPS